MFFENPKQRYRKLLIIIIPLFVALIVCGFFVYSNVSSALGHTTSEKKDTFNIESMDYHLRSNATDYQKELFKELGDLIDSNADDLAIAESVVKNYIADTYTWDNKKGQWDVGGMCYVFSPLKMNFYLHAKDEFYGLLNKYIDLYGNDGLLEVESIEVIESEKDTEKYETYGNTYDCFDVACRWDYSEDSRFTDVVDNVMYYKVIKNNDGRFEIVVNYEY